MNRLKKTKNYVATKIAYHILQKKSAENIARYEQVAIFSCDDIGHLINLTGRYEIEDLDIAFSFLKPRLNRSLAALDIGANIGNHSLYLSSVFAHVYSFEPNPKTYKLLDYNAHLKKNVTTYNIGLSNANRNSGLAIDQTNIGKSHLTEAEPYVEIVKLKKYESIEELKEIRIGLIKIDVEGHELEALEGAQNVIRRDHPIILFEQQPEDFIDGSSKVINMLREQGYHNFSIIETKSIIPIVGNRYLKTIITALNIMLGGYRKYVTRKENFTPRFYPFIIAEH